LSPSTLSTLIWQCCMKREFCVWFAALLISLLASGCLPTAEEPRDPLACPKPLAWASSSLADPVYKDQVEVAFTNKAGVRVAVFWVDFKGKEVRLIDIESGQRNTQNSFHGHVFHIRAAGTGKLIQIYKVKAPDQLSTVIVPCIGLEKERAVDESRWPEFEQLAVAEADKICEGADSSKWSCIRYVSDEDAAARDSSLYGFTQKEAEATSYKKGTTIDTIYRPQIKHIPNVSDYEQGYLKMQMTDKLKGLLKFYTESKHRTKTHDFVPGYFTNNHEVPMDILDINEFRDIRLMIIDEMRQVLQWWTKQELKHTTSFGLRVYKRDAMLINHLDRKDTHIASAILQVHQVVDENGGWPVEVYHPHRRGLSEVYLQPGEMLLYEGARLEHGRPMRFRGKEFANVFSHFSPMGFDGPTNWINPHYNPLTEL